MKLLITISCLFAIITSFGQNLEDLESYSVDELYKKINLEYGTLDENGMHISFVFINTELEAGSYKIELTDGPNDLYEVKGTDIFISFRGYFGYAGYSTEFIFES